MEQCSQQQAGRPSKLHLQITRLNHERFESELLKFSRILLKIPIIPYEGAFQSEKYIPSWRE